MEWYSITNKIVFPYCQAVVNFETGHFGLNWPTNFSKTGLFVFSMAGLFVINQPLIGVWNWVAN